MWSVLLPAQWYLIPVTRRLCFPLFTAEQKSCQDRDAIIFTQAILFSVSAQHSVSAVTQTVVTEFPIEGETVSVLGG